MGLTVLVEVYVLKIRVKFEKLGDLKYVGHLDLMRMVQRINKITGLPIDYSQGFNPHQQMAFALPLGVGFESYGDYMDMKVADSFFLSPTIADKWIERFNNRAPDGLKLTKIIPCNDKTPQSMTLVYASSYIIKPLYEDITQTLMEELMEKETIIIQKTTKRGSIVDFDLKPGILSLSMNENKELLMTLQTNSELTVKPEQVINVLLAPIKGEFLPHFYKQIRLDIYTQKEGQLISLGEYYE